MHRRTLLNILALAPLAGTVQAQSKPAAGGVANATSAAVVDGLEQTRVRNVDEVQRRPGVDWAAYTAFVLQPVSVSFSRNWNARDYGRMGLSAAEVGRMRAALAEIVTTEFAQALAQAGLKQATAAGEGVLAVRADIIDLVVNAPDTMAAGRTRSYVMSAGEMRLALELADSVTGTVLARARDRKRGTDTGQLMWANSVYNRVEAERAVRGWAGQLTNALESARSGR